MSLPEYEQHFSFRSPKLNSSLMSQHNVCALLAGVFIAFHTGVATFLELLVDFVFHNCGNSCRCSWKAQSSLDMGFHHCVAQLLQEILLRLSFLLFQSSFIFLHITKACRHCWSRTPLLRVVRWMRLKSLLK